MKKNILLIILSVVVVLLVGYIVYDKFLDDKDISNEDVTYTSDGNVKDGNTNDNVDNSYNFSNVFGVYATKVTLNNSNDGNEDSTASFTLYLFNDGTFKYETSYYAPSGVIGNYVIDDNGVVLTYWFNTNSSTELYVTKGTKTLTIDSDNNLIDRNPVYDEYGITNVKLIKSNDNNLITYYNNYSLSNILGTAFCNENTCITEPQM